MITFYAYTLSDSYMRRAAIANNFPWANGIAVDRRMASQYFRYLKHYGPLRLKRVIINEDAGYALVLGQNNTELDSIQLALRKRAYKLFGCPPRLYTEVPERRVYCGVVTPEEDVSGKGYKVNLIMIDTMRSNIPLTPEDERV